MAVLSKGALFDPELVKDLVNKVKGKSSLAKLHGQEPIPFNGMKVFTFSMDSEIDVVAENGKKTHGGVSVAPIKITPIKVDYGARLSDEFMIASEEEQINILKAFNDGFAKKIAKGLDIMAMHGFNPRTSAASAVIGTNHFDAAVTQKIDYAAATIDDIIDSAIKLVEDADGDVTAAILSPTVRSALAALKNSTNDRLYPSLAWGGNPGTLNGLPIDVNKTVSIGNVDQALVGDFEGSFKWGYAKEIPMEIIEYGDPDASGNDLKAYNQVYLRSEAYLGWGILDASAFARVTVPAVTPTPGQG